MVVKLESKLKPILLRLGRTQVKIQVPNKAISKIPSAESQVSLIKIIHSIRYTITFKALHIYIYISNF